MVEGNKIAEAARNSLKDASSFLVFDVEGNVLASSFEVNQAELKSIPALFDDRDEAIKQGIIVKGTRYEVHRHHPPLIYGRTMGGSPETSEGIAVCKVDNPSGGPAHIGLITYAMPNVSARMVPILQSFCEQNLVKSSSS